MSEICSESEEEEGEVGIDVIDIFKGKKSLDHMLTDDQKRFLQLRKGKSFNIMISDYKPFLHFRFSKLKKINSNDIKKM